MIFDAIEFAAKAHRNHYRKGTKVPYLIHPMRVSKILIDHGCDEEMASAAVLHDTVEDTDATLDDIQSQFGPRVASLVEGLSEPDRSDTWENRKQHTIDHLRHAPRDVLLIACADKLDNLRSMREDYAKFGEPFWDRFNRPKDKQQWYYRNVASVFVSRIDDELTKELFEALAAEVQAIFGTVPHSGD